MQQQIQNLSAQRSKLHVFQLLNNQIYSDYILSNIKNLGKKRLVSSYQLNAHFFYSITIYVTLLSSTCFDQYPAHSQEDKLYYYSLWYRHSL